MALEEQIIIVREDPNHLHNALRGRVRGPRGAAAAALGVDPFRLR